MLQQRLVGLHPTGHDSGIGDNPNDGFDTAKWIASQLWFDGHIGNMGDFFDVNPNTGELFNDNRGWHSADKILYLDTKHPPHIVLPVMSAQ